MSISRRSAKALVRRVVNAVIVASQLHLERREFDERKGGQLRALRRAQSAMSTGRGGRDPQKVCRRDEEQRRLR